MPPVFIRVIALLIALALTSSVLAGGGPKALDHLLARLEPLESLSAGFQQTVNSVDGFTVQEVTGHLTVARPGRLRWETDPPYEQLVVSDAESLWIYDPDLEQVTVRPFSRDISRTPAILFIGAVADLEASYLVTEKATAESTAFTLIPVDPNSLFEKVQLIFDGDTPIAMDLSDSLGQTTHVELIDPVINGPITEAAFAFVPPEGTDILRDE